jgi:hypothetical protein
MQKGRNLKMAARYDPFLFGSLDNWSFCRFCRHLNSLIEPPTCDAFPEGIPQEILSGKIIHKSPLPHQKNDIVLAPW